MGDTFSRLSMGGTGPQKDTPSLGSLTVLTYNVWFDSFEFATRMKFIIDETMKIQPDVCCFQEVLPQLNTMLLEHEELNKLYAISPFATTGYGNITLVRKTLSPRFSTTEFPSSYMGRSLLKAVFAVNGADIAIGNVHLESLNSEKEREKQLQISERSLRQYQLSLLVGDFNFCSERNFRIVPNQPLENDVLSKVLPEYVDVWPLLHAEEKDRQGYTFDSEVNKMISRPERMRYDRVLIRGVGTCRGVSPSDISLVGVDAIIMPAKLPTAVWPSDHFGLLASFKLLQDAKGPGEVSQTLSQDIHIDEGKR